MDLPILSQHRKEIERLVKEKHLSPEDALKLLIESHSDDQQAQFQKEEPSLQVTITISGKLISKGDLKELKKQVECPLHGSVFNVTLERS